MHHLIHQPHLQRFLRANIAARQNHIQRRLQTDQRRQALRPTRTRNEPQLHLRQRQDRFRMIRENAMGTRECHFKTTA